MYLINTIYGAHWESDIKKHVQAHFNAVKTNATNNSCKYETTLENLSRIVNKAKQIASFKNSRDRAKVTAANYTAIQLENGSIIYAKQQTLLNLVEKRLQRTETYSVSIDTKIDSPLSIPDSKSEDTTAINECKEINDDQSEDQSNAIDISLRNVSDKTKVSARVTAEDGHLLQNESSVECSQLIKDHLEITTEIVTPVDHVVLDAIPDETFPDTSPDMISHMTSS